MSPNETLVPVEIDFTNGQVTQESFQVVLENQDSKVCGISR